MQPQTAPLAGGAERRPTQESVVTALPAGYATPDYARFPGAEPGSDPDWFMVGDQPASGSPPAPLPPELVASPVPPTETEALLPRKGGQPKDTHAHMRDIVTWSAIAELSITPLVLLMSVSNRGHHLDVRSRPGNGCHNMWVWLAFLALLDFVHLLLHQFEAVVQGKDCLLRRVFTGGKKAETKEETDAQDLKDITRLDQALHYGDAVTLSAKILLSWFGVWMVIGLGGFFLVSLAVCLGGALVAAATVFAKAAANNAAAGVGVGTTIGLTLVAIFMAILVDRATGSPCHDVLHFWAMLVASAYSVTLLIALVLLVYSLRESRFWAKRLFARSGRAPRTQRSTT
jgi:hypothetical protein